MRFLLTLGSLSCMGFLFLQGRYAFTRYDITLVTTVGYWSSLVFYNSYLPEIAAPEDRDRISAKGFVWLYWQCAVAGCIGLVLVMLAGDNEKRKPMRCRMTFVLVGIWWFGFAQITLKHMPRRKELKKPITKYFQQRVSWTGQSASPDKINTGTLVVLCAFFFYNIGVQTVMLIATNFGKEELALDTLCW